MGSTLGSNRIGLLAAAFLAVVGYPATLAAGDNEWPPPGVSFNGDPKAPDISGLWLGSATGIPGKGPQTNSGESADGRPPAYWAPWPLPYTPAYQKIYLERVEAMKKGRALGDQGAQCLPFGPALTGAVYPNEIVQTPGEVTLFIWQGGSTVIWTDGRPHPKNLQPSYKGHSIGYWVGDTLFVDTVGMKPGRFAIGGAHSDKLRFETIIRPVAKDVLLFYVTAYDEEALTEPVTITNIFHRVTDPKWQMLDDSSCFENNKETIDSSGAAGFPKF